jgi:hypothetical protein
MSDTQLIAFFKRPSTGSLCGRFLDDQLDRNIEISRKRIPWVKYFFQFTIPIFLTSLKAQSQVNLSLKERTCSQTIIDPEKGLRVRVGGAVAFHESKKIPGRVTDEKGVGISFASVYIKGTNTGTSCDSTGFFELTTKTDEQKIILIVSSVGYSVIEKQINTLKDSSTEIILQAHTVLSGDVVVTCSSRTRLGGFSIRSTRISYMEKVKSFFKSDSIKVFPNPAKAGNQTKIEWKKAETGEYKNDLYSLQGQLIKSSLAKIENEINSFTFQIPVITPGSYLLQMTNKKSGKKYTAKIIIQ